MTRTDAAGSRRDKVVLVDAYSLIHRAFYALPPMHTSQGEPTNAVLGFANMLLALLDEEQPGYAAVAFDRSGPTFRDELFDEYKANRPPMPDDLRPQIAHTEAFLEAMQVPVFGEAGFEADDVIGTLARQAVEHGLDVLIVTGDRDLLQLVDDHVQVLVTRRGIRDMDRMDPAGVKELLGVTPDRVTDLKGLMGDSSDNIPGVPRVGPKTAVRLLEQYGTLEKVLEHAEEVRGQVGENLRTHAEQARLSKKLSIIRTDAPTVFDPEKTKLKGPDMAAVTELAARLEMRTLLDRIRKRAEERGELEPDCETGPRSEVGLEVSVAGDGAAVEAAVGAVLKDAAPGGGEEAKPVAVQVLADGEDPMRADVVGLFIGTASIAYYIPFSSEEDKADGGLFAGGEGSGGSGEGVAPGVAVGALRPLLENPAVPKWCDDVKRVGTLLDRLGVALQGPFADVSLASYLVNPEGNHALPDAAMRHLDRFVPTWRQRLLDAGEGRRPAPLRGLERETIARHLAEDGDVLFELMPVLLQKLRDDDLVDLYESVELPLTDVLRRAETRGVRLDTHYLAELSREMQSQIDGLTKKIFALAGQQFNINSPKQLGTVLFEKLGLPVVKRTKSGPSTDHEVLETLAEEHAIAELLLEYRQTTKLKSTYVDALPELVHPETGRVHTNFNQTVTATGRLSSVNPNLQNIPVRTPEGRRIRKAFVPGEEGWVMMTADYSQIELRVLAHISEDETLIEAFRRGEDIHTRTAAEVFELDPEAVTPTQREAAKAINFGIVYGISSFGLARGTGLSRQDAQRYIDEYFDRYPGVKRYIDATIALGREQGYVTTLLKRRRYLPELRSRNWARRSFAERTAMNTPIQGSAADIIKLAMIAADENLRAAGLQARLLLQVHDELVLELPAAEVGDAARIVRDSMADVVRLSVPLVIDVEAGPNWLDTEPVAVAAEEAPHA